MTGTFKTRIISKNEPPAVWAAATDFVPFEGELIVYNKDENSPPRLKIGDGESNVDNLPFVAGDANSITYSLEASVDIADISFEIRNSEKLAQLNIWINTSCAETENNNTLGIMLNDGAFEAQFGEDHIEENNLFGKITIAKNKNETLTFSYSLNNQITGVATVEFLENIEKVTLLNNNGSLFLQGSSVIVQEVYYS